MSRALLSCLILWLPLVYLSTVRPLVILGSSMEPTLHPGQLVLLHREYYRTRPVERRHVVAFKWKGRVYVKRVHALAGERVALLCHHGYCMLVPGKTLDAKARRLARNWPHFCVRVVRVPPGHFFSLGDHPTASLDSRDFGPVPLSAIVGRVQSLRVRRPGA